MTEILRVLVHWQKAKSEKRRKSFIILIILCLVCVKNWLNTLWTLLFIVTWNWIFYWLVNEKESGVFKFWRRIVNFAKIIDFIRKMNWCSEIWLGKNKYNVKSLQLRGFVCERRNRNVDQVKSHFRLDIMIHFEKQKVSLLVTAGFYQVNAN